MPVLQEMQTPKASHQAVTPYSVPRVMRMGLTAMLLLPGTLELACETLMGMTHAKALAILVQACCRTRKTQSCSSTCCSCTPG